MTKRENIKKKVSNNSRFFSFAMIAIGVAIVTSFIAILFLVSTNSNKNEENTHSVNSSTSEVVTEKPPVSLPTKPEDRFTYIKELENPDYNQSSITSQNAVFQSNEKERQQILNSFAQTTKAEVTSKAIKKNTVATFSDSKSNRATSTKQQADVWIQCGAFKDRNNAEALKDKLVSNGIIGAIKEGKLYRVLGGGFSSKDSANEAIAKLKNSKIASCIISK